MRSIRVTYENGDYTDTQINGTEDEIRRYYLGNIFNVGIGPEDNLLRAVKIEFYRPFLVLSRPVNIGVDFQPLRCFSAVNPAQAIDQAFAERDKHNVLQPLPSERNKDKDGSEAKPFYISPATEAMAREATEDDQAEMWLNPCYRDERERIKVLEEQGLRPVWDMSQFMYAETPT